MYKSLHKKNVLYVIYVAFLILNKTHVEMLQKFETYLKRLKIAGPEDGDTVRI